MLALFGGTALAAMIGLLDDVLNLRARWQLLTQLILAIGAVLLGITIDSIANPFGPGQIDLAGVWGVAFTVFWIVGMINSINWIDGLDGLSSGIGVIAAFTLGLISLTVSAGLFGQPYVALMCFALAGALLGFLRWNFHPATIFVGTSGVMVIGYSLAVLSILGTAKVAVALLVLGVPIIDTFWNIVRRLATGASPFTPDRGHVHHRLMDLGLSQTQAVLVIYGLTLVLAVLSFVLSGAGQLYAFLGVVVASGVLLLVVTRRSLVMDDFRAESYERNEPAVRAPAVPRSPCRGRNGNPRRRPRPVRSKWCRRSRFARTDRSGPGLRTATNRRAAPWSALPGRSRAIGTLPNPHSGGRVLASASDPSDREPAPTNP